MTDFERSLLGAEIRRPDTTIDDVRAIIPNVRIFSCSTAREIQAAINRLYDKGDPINIVTVSDSFRSTVKPSFVADLTSRPETSGDVTYLARKVLDESVARAFEASTREALQSLSAAADPRELIEDHLVHLEKILNAGGGSDDSLREICAKAEVEVRENYRDPRRQYGFPLGAPCDKISKGIRKTHVCIILAPTSTGKSVLMQQGAGTIALGGTRVLYLTLEMTAQEVQFRISAQLARDHVRQLEYPTCDAQLNKSLRVIGETAELPLDIIYRPGMRITELVPIVRRKVRREGVEVVFVDYLNLVKVPNATDSMYRDVGTITSTLKELAGKLNIAIIAGAQANREGYGKSVRVEHVGESLKIVQDADTVIAIEADQNEDGEFAIRGRLNVRKQRNGPRGWVPYNFHPGYLRFEEP